jgi:hypothetical protein
VSHKSLRLLVEHTVKSLTDTVQYSYGEESDFAQTQKKDFLMVNTQLMPASAAFVDNQVFNYSKTWIIRTAFFKFDKLDSIDYYLIHDEIDPLCYQFINKLNQRDDLVILSTRQDPFVKVFDIMTGYLVEATVRLNDDFNYCWECD